MSKPFRFSAEQIECMVALCHSGKSTRDIAGVFGCGKSTVSTVLRSAGAAISSSRSISVKAKGKPSHRKGATQSHESRQKMRAAQVGRAPTRTGPHSPETIAKMSVALKGKNLLYTPEEKKQIELSRQLCKRLVRRVLSATGRRKLIPSEQYLGYTKAELRAHIGDRPEGCDLDHYVPVIEFIRRGITNPAAINAMANLRWLESSENKKKSDKIPEDAERVIAICLLSANFVTQPSGKASYTKGL